MNLKIFIFLVLFTLFSIDCASNDGRGITHLPNGTNLRTALVIGNGDYKTSPLRNPPNDARAIANALMESGFDVTVEINASQRDMEVAVRTFGKKLQNGGVGLFYYAGHGIQVNGRNYLLPIETTIESESDVKYEAVDAGLVLGKMEDAENDLNIVILDACRNNPFARSFRSAEQGLARMDAPKGSLIAYATAPGSVAADGEDGNGIYTKHLVHNIKNSELTIEQILKQVRVAVVRETANKQVPWESSSLMGNFYFKSAGGVNVSTSPKSTGKLDEEEELWLLVKDSTNLGDIESFLTAFPGGRFETHAKLRLKQLRRTESKRVSGTEQHKTEKMLRYFPMGLDDYLEMGVPVSSAKKIIELVNSAEKQPDNIKTIVDLGNLYFDNNLVKFAIKSYERSLKLDPENANVLTDLGVMYRRDGDLKKSLECFDKALSINPKLESAYFNKGVVLFYNFNDKAGAINTWEKLLYVSPSFVAPNGKSVEEFIEEYRTM